MMSIVQPLPPGFDDYSTELSTEDMARQDFVNHREHALQDLHSDSTLHAMRPNHVAATPLMIMASNQCSYGISEYLSVGMVPFLTVGLTLTTISIYVYTRPAQLKTTIGFLLACLSVSEWLFLLTALDCFSISRIPLITCSRVPGEYSLFKAYSDVYVYPFVHITKYMCVCISIIISIQQWISVFVPFKVKELCSMSRTKLMIFLSAVISLVLAIPKFLEKEVNYYTGRTRDNKYWKNSTLFDGIEYFNNSFFNAFTIFFVIFVINISMICLLKWSQHERMRMTNQSPKDRRTYIMLLAVLFSYVITHFPSMMIEYFDDVLKASLPLEIADVRKELSNFFTCCHPILSFADYMIFSANYRKTVKSLLVCNRKKEPRAVIGSKKTPLL